MVLQSTVEKQIGRRYGRLVVLEFCRKANKREYFYKAKCDCGTIKEYRINALRQGGTKSCGCYARDVWRKTHTGNQYRRLPENVGFANHLYTRKLVEAKRRKIPFTISKETFGRLTKSNCFYCDAPPQNKPATSYNGAFFWSGLDRVDNALGYTEENSVACCRKCNSIKNGITRQIIIRAYHFLNKSASA